MTIGVLALQGGFIEHINMLERLGVAAKTVYRADELKDIDGLIIPGGESTTMLNLMHSFCIFEPLKEQIHSGLPVLATCAGVVLLSKNVSNPEMDTLALMDISVRRNAFGRQVDSFEADIDIPALGEEPFPAIFIRAPIIKSASPDTEILGNLDNGNIVAVRQKNMLAISFHPELGKDARLHRYFLQMAADCSGTEKVNSAPKAAIPAD